MIDPSAEELAGIALASARSARQFLGVTPRVAMLSFSTAGSAAHPKVDKVKKATELAAAQMKDGYVAGEFQFDAAVDPGVAQKKKVGGGEVAGKANVFIFPDLNAANIAYKAVNRLAGAAAIGPILQGFAKPVNDLVARRRCRGRRGHGRHHRAPGERVGAPPVAAPLDHPAHPEGMRQKSEDPGHQRRQFVPEMLALRHARGDGACQRAGGEDRRRQLLPAHEFGRGERQARL